MEEDFHSLNKGVFVIPFQEGEQPEAGPSSRPLAKAYDHAFERFEVAYKTYESTRATEQLGDIAQWLQRTSEPPLLKQSFPIHRLPVALVQSLSADVAPQLTTATSRVARVGGREMPDIAAAARAVAVGFLGEAALEAKKAGRTPIDEVERWWRRQRDEPPLLVYIEQGQVVSNDVLSDLIYILTLHQDLPFRLLISVPSIMTFLSTWTPLEPSEIDLSILSSARTRSRGAAVDAIVQAATDNPSTPFFVTDALANELRHQEELLGGGATKALKYLKWLMLHHSFNSPLSTLGGADAAETDVQNLQTILEGIKVGKPVPGLDLFAVDRLPDVISTQSPAPRMSIIQGIGRLDTEANQEANGESQAGPAVDAEQPADVQTSPRKSGRQGAKPDYTKLSGKTTRRSRARDPEAPEINVAAAASTNGTTHTSAPVSDPFKEIEALFSLWRNAGKAINLWDWLQGFQSSVLEKDAPDESSAANDDEPQTPKKRKRAEGDEGEEPEVMMDEETEARVHARFIRFVEESRMLGLVRTRGRGPRKRSDEVVKGVLLI